LSTPVVVVVVAVVWQKVVARKGHAVVVVAEGAGEEVLGTSAEVDAGGNKKLPEIGPFMVKKIVEHFKSQVRHNKNWRCSH
jgi:6-phosphofructokinase 1